MYWHGQEPRVETGEAYVASGKLNVQPIGTTHQLADIFTKTLGAGRFGDLRGQLGFHDQQGVTFG